VKRLVPLSILVAVCVAHASWDSVFTHMVMGFHQWGPVR
jgi:hypothetical protein